MLYLALVSFSGTVSMHKGEVREISDSTLVDDLLKAGYITLYESTRKDEVKEDVSEKPIKKRKGKGNEN